MASVSIIQMSAALRLCSHSTDLGPLRLPMALAEWPVIYPTWGQLVVCEHCLNHELCKFTL